MAAGIDADRIMKAIAEVAPFGPTRLQAGKDMRLTFGNCVLDPSRGELRRDGEAVHVRAKVFDVLGYLCLNRDRVVSRDELLSHVWPDVTVSDATLSSTIRAMRRAIGDDARNPRYLKTLHGRGYRFVADVGVEQELGDIAAEAGAPGQQAENVAIAILPFENRNAEPGLDYLAEGLPEDIITDISRFKLLTVIARNSTFRYRANAVDIRQVGKDLGANYVLQGSVRRVGDAVRVTAQLSHAPTTKQLWADRYDSPIETMAVLQDEIVRQIVASVWPEVTLEEFRQASSYPTESPRAVETAWRARMLMERSRTEGKQELYAEGMRLAEEAVALDPQCRNAWHIVALGNTLLAFARVGQETGEFASRARQAVEMLRSLDRNDHRAHMMLGWLGYIERDLTQAEMHLSLAHDLNPNCTMTLTMLGVVATALGRAQDGYDAIARAIRLSPRDFWLGFMLASQAFACFALDRFEEGVVLARRAIQVQPHAPANHLILAGCLAVTGDLDGAAAAIRRQRTINEPLLRRYENGEQSPYTNQAISERYLSAIRTAIAAADSGDGVTALRKPG